MCGLSAKVCSFPSECLFAKLEKECGESGRFPCVMHFLIMISFITLGSGQRDRLMKNKLATKRTFNIPCTFIIHNTLQASRVHDQTEPETRMHISRLSSYIHVPNPASHDHALDMVLLCKRVWPIQLLCVPLFIYTIQDRLHPQHTSPLPCSKSIHTLTHTPGAWSPQAAPRHPPPRCPPVVELNCVCPLYMYVCVRM